MPYPTGVDAGWRGVRTKRYTYARYEERPWVLFDNQEDPYQLNNLAEDPNAEKLRQEMNALTQDWMKRSDDSWSNDVPKTTILHRNPVEEHAAMIAEAYRGAED
jgi:arylsulfatase A-like enzyme